MKEILYIQAGTQANYIGTHFWNTQESYFTYEEEADSSADASEIDHQISFRDGLNQKGEPTFCPRLLVFDHKAQFGTLSQANALFGMDATVEEEILWSGDPAEYKQEPVSKSHYQTDLEASEMNPGATSSAELDDIRYWSDFNRLYYVPRTIQKIPDIPDWEDAEGNWAGGLETFTRYDEETGLMEGPLRLFLEECETIQGIQLMHDASTFGSFIHSFLTGVRDDFAKLPLLAWPLLSNTIAPVNNLDNRRGARKLINDALAMRSLSELSSMSIPIQSPATWPDEVCNNTYIDASSAHAYHTSAILSAHIETITLPLRLTAAKDDIQSFSAQLSWRTASPFAGLRGVFPCADGVGLEHRIYNFSSSTPTPGQVQLSRRDVTRGFSPSGITSYHEWLSGSDTRGSMVSSTHAAAYPLPTSFPAFFSPTEDTLPRNGPPGVLSRPHFTSVFSSIGATSGASDFFSGYARFVADSVRRKISISEAGIDLDEMADLANDLWTLHYNAGGETEPGSDEDVRGEDEE
ncbi:Misato segment II tubulin-like domain-containing protein [Mycena polygramma]|nr:Misato segment II tubulin-like domain-containing protein [Mycena polygramma]